MRSSQLLCVAVVVLVLVALVSANSVDEFASDVASEDHHDIAKRSYKFSFKKPRRQKFSFSRKKFSFKKPRRKNRKSFGRKKHGFFG